MLDNLRVTDPAVYAVVKAEAGRQASQLELIASENFVSLAVLEAMGTVLTNKYAEGLPGKRYYGGCEHVDVVEDLAVHNCWICDQAIRLGYFDFAFDGESADADGKQVNLDELLKRQFDEGDANKASEFDEDVTKILGKEKELSQHVRDDLQPAPVTIGHSDDEEGEGDPDDVFSGLPLGARGKAWSL